MTAIPESGSGLSRPGSWHLGDGIHIHACELMASKQVQSEVMDAYEAAFKTTPILLRYPANEHAWSHAANHLRRLGYHDDSFAWATLDTGRQEDNWFFLPALKAAGPQALDKWQTCPLEAKSVRSYGERSSIANLPIPKPKTLTSAYVSAMCRG